MSGFRLRTLRDCVLRLLRRKPAPTFPSLLRESLAAQRRSSLAVVSDEFDGILRHPHNQETISCP